LQNRYTKAANKSNSATVRIQEYPKVTLLAEVCNVAGNAQEVASVVLKGDAANGSTTVKYGFVLSTGAVGKCNGILEAPLELVAKGVHTILDVKRLLDKEPMSFEQWVELPIDGNQAGLEDQHAVNTFKTCKARNSTARRCMRAGGRCNALCHSFPGPLYGP
jgi:hypothetical protein